MKRRQFLKAASGLFIPVIPAIIRPAVAQGPVLPSPGLPVSGGGGPPFVWDSANAGIGAAFANSDRDYTGTSRSNWTTVRSTIGKSTGSWYCEIKLVTTDASPPVFPGMVTSAATVTDNFPGSTAKGASHYWQGNSTFTNGVSNPNTVTSVSISDGDIFQLAYDFTNGKVWLGLNNTWLCGDPATGTTPWLTFTPGDTWYVATANNQGVGVPGSSVTQQLLSTITYSPPSGFTTLNA